jgi:hypothetical protein
MRRTSRPALATLTLLTALAAALAAPAADAAPACGKAGYAYAGFQNAGRAHGVSATLRSISSPAVENGHVAAWVGVGGPGLGPGGSDAWIQVGFSAFPFRATGSLYYEVNRPGIGPVYHEVRATVLPGRRHRVAVLETRKRDWWRVWVDRKPVSPPLHLRASSGRWHPIATAETWDGGRRSCNRFEYRFENVSVAAAPGGSWKRFVQGYRFLDPGYRLVSSGVGTFLARSALRPPATVTATAPAAPRTPSPPAAPAVPVSAPAAPAADPEPVAAPE